ncbi:hypothetical protein HY285_03510 [Candidatus Peregrinibacteria bacterium]|nr:hypothetical protein [Candidatus Peregrinibacteria bacterium]MBI3816583.1 hypothetical protein [Candidatus Peregrinibacteria bacterium]
MLKFLHQLSAIFFSLLGSSFFVAYLLVRNSIGGIWPAWWLQVADLPLALCALMYGGLSLYQSLTIKGHSRALGWTLGVITGIFFLFIVFLNFSNLW